MLTELYCEESMNAYSYQFIALNNNTKNINTIAVIYNFSPSVMHEINFNNIDLFMNLLC